MRIQRYAAVYYLFLPHKLIGPTNLKYPAAIGKKLLLFSSIKLVSECACRAWLNDNGVNTTSGIIGMVSGIYHKAFYMPFVVNESFILHLSFGGSYVRKDMQNKNHRYSRTFIAAIILIKRAITY